MPRKRKTANEMTDDELMEKAFSKRVLRAVKREIVEEPDEPDTTEIPSPPDNP